MPALIVDFLWHCWLVILEMSPYLLFGFALAGLISIWLSPAWIERHLGGKGLAPVLKATLLGIPLPLCSCSVIPVVASMRRHGASRAAATSFLLSTPQTGVDSIAVTYALLGPVFAVFRPIAALASGILGGVLVLILDRNGSQASGELAACADSCCSTVHAEPAWLRAVRHGFITLPRDLSLPLLTGVLIAGAIGALVPPRSLHDYLGGGLLSILAMMAVGIPLYVCATASVPIAVGLLALGASPGAVLAFLIAGPATNAATMTTMWKVMGRRTTFIYLLTVASSAVLCGLLMDLVATHLAGWVPQLAGHADHAHCPPESVGLWANFWAVALLAVLIGSRLPLGAGARPAVPSSMPAEPESRPEPACGCGCSPKPLHKLTKE